MYPFKFIRGCFPLFLVHHFWPLKSQVNFLLLGAMRLMRSLPWLRLMCWISFCSKMSHEQEPSYFPIYWLLNRDNGVQPKNKKKRSWSLTNRPWKDTGTQKETIVFQPSFFGGELLNFGGVYPKLRLLRRGWQLVVIQLILGKPDSKKVHKSPISYVQKLIILYSFQLFLWYYWDAITAFCEILDRCVSTASKWSAYEYHAILLKTSQDPLPVASVVLAVTVSYGKAHHPSC